MMRRKSQGRYVTISTAGEKARAFIPAPLPPEPAIEWSSDLRSKFDQAHLALGRLDSISTFLPEISVFLYMYVRKEAVLSSMIEGTQSSISDLLLFELDIEPDADRALDEGVFEEGPPALDLSDLTASLDAEDAEAVSGGEDIPEPELELNLDAGESGDAEELVLEMDDTDQAGATGAIVEETRELDVDELEALLEGADEASGADEEASSDSLELDIDLDGDYTGHIVSIDGPDGDLDRTIAGVRGVPCVGVLITGNVHLLPFTLADLYLDLVDIRLGIHLCSDLYLIGDRPAVPGRFDGYNRSSRQLLRECLAHGIHVICSEI